MPEIGRNDPCPCGSGKKYKRCCLLVREEEERAARVLSGGLGRALDWLFEAHGPAMQAAIEGDFFAAGRDGIQQLFAGLSPAHRETLEVNLNDWLLADAAIEVDGARRRAVELLAADGAPALEPAVRERIAEMARRPLALYAVEAGDGEAEGGFWLRDGLDPAACRVWVEEAERADRPRAGALVGARLLEVGEGHILSGSLYTFPMNPKEPAEPAQEKALAAVRAAGEGGAGPAILRVWLDLLAAAKAS